MRSDNEESLKHVLTAACERVHLEYSNTRLETLAPSDEVRNSVRTVKEMVQRETESGNALDITFSIKHTVFAPFARHSECILNHLERNDFLVQYDNRMTKTSRYESHRKSCSKVNTSTQSYFGWSMMTEKSHVFNKLRFWV